MTAIGFGLLLAVWGVFWFAVAIRHDDPPKWVMAMVLLMGLLGVASLWWIAP